MVIEEVRYDFEDYPKYADGFIRNLLRLMLLSKLNSSAKSSPSKEFFLEIISGINGCEAYVVNYGQPLLYVKYGGVAFTDQKVSCQFVRVKEHIIDVTLESVFSDFAKTFDGLASSSQSQVHWGVTNSTDQQPSPLFAILDSFIDAVTRLSELPRSNTDSLLGRRFAIRNAFFAKRSIYLEFLIDGALNILQLNPLKKKRTAAISLILSPSEAAKAIGALMVQT